jgi:galactoside O-acetyltransferase
MIENENNRLKYYGQDIKIHPLASIVKPEVIEVGDFSVIDDFAFINGGAGIKIGKHVHIASFVSVVGGGELIIGDHTIIGHGTKIITAINSYQNQDAVPADLLEDLGAANKGKVIIEKGVFIGNDVVVHPNTRIREGSIIGSYSQVGGYESLEHQDW